MIRSLNTVMLFVLALLLLLVAIVVARDFFNVVAHYGERYPGATEPAVELGLVIDGELTIGTNIARRSTSPPTLVEGTSVVPVVTAVELDGPPPEVELVLGGKRLKPGQPFTAQRRGYFTLKAETPDEWTPSTAQMMIEVADRPKYTATLSIEDVEVTRNDEGITGIDTTIRLSADAFCIKCIYLTHISLWLEGADRITTIDRVSLETEDSRTSRDAHWHGDGEYWIMTFRSRFEEPVQEYPAEAMVTGTGWREGGYVDYSSSPIEFPPEPEANAAALPDQE